jgi:hypothetical protein
MTPRTVTWLIAAALACSCINQTTNPPSPVAPEIWDPGTRYRTPAAANARGYLDRRGLIHAHSFHSHDACDGAPRNDAGVFDQSCNADFRRGLCQAKHDFVFLTDHPGFFTEVEYPEALLYDGQQGDALVDHGAGPVASWMGCGDGGTASLVMGGAESSTMMPVGLEGHVAPAAIRGSIYGDDSPAAYLEVKAHGGVALIAHPEGWTADQLATLPIDGFEMYNLHANSLLNAGVVADLVFQVDRGEFEGLPHPDLFLTAYAKFEDPRYLEIWGTVLSRGVHRTTTVGTDCHRNTFKSLMPDGERIDSYRRMMLSFSNHLLVKPAADGSWDDRSLKEALKGGRLYGAFEYLGYPVGFDATALEGKEVRELGATVSLAAGVTLKLKVPMVENLDPAVDPPVLHARWLKAREGGWDVIAEGPGPTLDATPTTPGAYRAEVQMIPKHLLPHIGKRRDLIKAERPWVYSNAIYVVP